MAARNFDSRPDYWVSLVLTSDAEAPALQAVIDTVRIDGAIMRNSRRIFSALVREARQERHIRWS